MSYSYEDKLEALHDRCGKSLDALLVLLDRLREVKEAERARGGEVGVLLERVFQRLGFFKEYYFLLAKAFLLPTVAARNELGRRFDSIPEGERNRIDFANFSRENFDAIDGFLTSFVFRKLDELAAALAAGGYDAEEARKDAVYAVG